MILSIIRGNRATPTRLFRTATTHITTYKPLSTHSRNQQQPTTASTHQDSSTDQSGVVVSDESRLAQAPNRTAVWSHNQQSRAKAMVGPRFEQMNLEDQPQPWSAIDLIHNEPVRWSHDRVVSCDGGGGPHGHPRIYINLDKPKITPCTYCGTPFANEHHRKFLQSLPSTPYPLE